MENPFLKDNTDTHVLKCVLSPNFTTNNELHYVAITKNQITLNKYGVFEVCDDLDLNI